MSIIGSNIIADMFWIFYALISTLHVFRIFKIQTQRIGVYIAVNTRRISEYSYEGDQIQGQQNDQSYCCEVDCRHVESSLDNRLEWLVWWF